MSVEPRGPRSPADRRRPRPACCALASQALAKMPAAHVPASLRKSAQFTPTKRAKLIGAQLVESARDG